MQHALTAVTHGVACRHFVNLQDSGLQRTDIVQDMVGIRVDAIQADTQADHIELSSRITLDAGRVADMPQNLVLESSLQGSRRRFEGFYLTTGERIESFRITAH